jgi:uncharacterized membrane protein
MARILLLGESAMSARYLTGTWAHGRYQVRHIQARERLGYLDELFDVVVFSDYPSAQLGAEASRQIVQAVEDGAGLVMIGGWTSFTGNGGDYGQTPLAPLLPVTCAPTDDRRNVASGLWLEAVQPAHPILRGLDFAAPPVMCGYNAVTVADGATLLARGRLVTFQDDSKHGPIPAAGESVPLLAVGQAGAGRAVAYMSDLVPHWCGGMVDWGSERLRLPS